MLSADANTSQPFHEVLLDKVKEFDFEHVVIHMPLRDAFLSIVGVGFIVYLIFKRWEPTNLPLLAFLLVLTPASLSTLVTPHLGSVKGTALSFLTYWATILISVTFYRLSPFHPLARYPGPIMCKLTKFWGFYKELDGKQHLYIESLHDKYGDVVRIGPNEISLRDASAIQPLMGTTGCPKGPNWRARAMHPPVYSLITQRDPAEHARRRRPWNRAFNTAGLKNYEPIIAKRAGQLVEAVGDHKGTQDLAQWISFFTYDFMGDMAFGGGTEMLREGDKDGSWQILKDGLDKMMIFDHLPWLSYIAKQLPMAGEIKRLRASAMRRAGARYERGATYRDLFYYLSNEDGGEKVNPSPEQVLSDSVLAIGAGADTTASVLSNTFWLLLRHPQYYKRLQAEVDHFYPPDEDSLDVKHHPQMVFLEAVIRCVSTQYVPGGSQRAPIPGQGDRIIGPYYLPEGNMARVHFWSLHRDSRNFTHADTYWPERWLIAEGLEKARAGEAFVHNPNAFIPFSFGPANCVGKNLALSEMRMVVTHFMQKLELRFPEGYDPMEWDRELEDRFVMKIGSLPVVARWRHH